MDNAMNVWLIMMVGSMKVLLVLCVVSVVGTYAVMKMAEKIDR